jgi:hypothetical protein
MNEFLYEFLPKKHKWKYRMLANYTINVAQYGIRPIITVDLPPLKLTKTGMLTLKKNWQWNGASGPAIDTTNFMRGCAVHDALYYFIRAKLLPMSARKKADKALRRIIREDGMNWFRAKYVYHFVRVWGGRTV